ncbi:MAG: hypothetical protein KAY32_16065 [Candidatus Eisenbacteria sp.]|nr:hypothetical protein [Candidatus Eisenbacteria bacterium]
MIELRDDALHFSFPRVHPGARLTVCFQRTLRIPDDDNDYPLPPGLGRFPLCHVDDFAETIPQPWIQHGGVMLPMYQAEAMWLDFDAPDVDDHWVPYPFAVKIATSKVNAVTGAEWSPALSRKPQDYLVVPEQPWLDGFCVEKGIIRQFVAMPLGAGYSAEEQITGQDQHGGLQIEEYARAGLPWFEYTDEQASAVEGAEALKKMKSVVTLGKAKGDVPLPENEAVDVERLVQIPKRLSKEQVREGSF